MASTGNTGQQLSVVDSASKCSTGSSGLLMQRTRGDGYSEDVLFEGGMQQGKPQQLLLSAVKRPRLASYEPPQAELIESVASPALRSRSPAPISSVPAPAPVPAAAFGAYNDSSNRGNVATNSSTSATRAGEIDADVSSSAQRTSEIDAGRNPHSAAAAKQIISQLTLVLEQERQDVTTALEARKAGMLSSLSTQAQSLLDLISASSASAMKEIDEALARVEAAAMRAESVANTCHANLCSAADAMEAAVAAVHDVLVEVAGLRAADVFPLDGDAAAAAAVDAALPSVLITAIADGAALHTSGSSSISGGSTSDLPSSGSRSSPTAAAPTGSVAASTVGAAVATLHTSNERLLIDEEVARAPRVLNEARCHLLRVLYTSEESLLPERKQLFEAIEALESQIIAVAASAPALDLDESDGVRMT